MYLFISFVLFLVEFSLPNFHTTETQKTQPTHSLQLFLDSSTVKKSEDKTTDTLAQGVYRNKSSIEVEDDAWVNQVANNYNSVHAYDSTQLTLPVAKRDGRLSRFIARGIISFVNYAKEHPTTWSEDFKEMFVHSIPKMLFTSIPFFAFLLWLLYFRKRKDFYFVAHGIFTIHLYCATFVMLIAFFPFTFLKGNLFFISFMLFGILTTIYRYLALKRFYQQGHFLTIIKFLLLSFSSTILFLAIILAFTFNTLIVLSNGGH